MGDTGDDIISRGVKNLDISNKFGAGSLLKTSDTYGRKSRSKRNGCKDFRDEIREQIISGVAKGRGPKDVLAQCHICYNLHRRSFCPYMKHYPKGAPYNKVGYEIMCWCGNHFNEEKWICSSCGDTERVVLMEKKCIICHGFNHGSHECPMDNNRAAGFKRIRDRLRSRVPPHMKDAPEYDAGYVPADDSAYAPAADDSAYAPADDGSAYAPADDYSAYALSSSSNIYQHW